MPLPMDKKHKSIRMLQRLIAKNEFMQDILEKIAKNMNDQVALVDNILTEFKNLAKCNNSDSQLYSIQRSFQFIHQELIRLDECYHLITKQSPNESITENLWQI
jgi:energy-converting hydrogenase A subunit M